MQILLLLPPENLCDASLSSSSSDTPSICAVLLVSLGYLRGYCIEMIGRPPTPPEIRFWPKVNKEPGRNTCWEWTGVCYKGYGNFSVGGSRGRMYAHRYSYELHFGNIPVGLLVLHKCDNRRCVRPSHLFVGTQSDNIKDSIKKGRWPDISGERNPMFGCRSIGFTGRQHTKAAKDKMSETRRGRNNPNYKHGKCCK